MKQPGAAPKRYSQRAHVCQGTMDMTLNMSFLIDAVGMAIRKPGMAPKNSEPDNAEGSQRMTALVEAVEKIVRQPGAAPKSYSRRAHVCQGATNRTLSISFLTDAVTMAWQKPGALKKSELGNGEGSQRMTALV